MEDNNSPLAPTAKEPSGDVTLMDPIPNWLEQTILNGVLIAIHSLLGRHCH